MHIKLHKLICSSILILLVFVFSSFCNPSQSFAQTVCNEKFPVTQNGITENLLYCSNKKLNVPDNTVKRLIIVVHGDSRNPDGYFQYMMNAAQKASSTDSLIIAPFFATNTDLTNTSNTLYWSAQGWKSGDPSLSPAKISSYTALDQLIKYVASGNIFPNLKKIIITGHSAGGQLTSRYSAGTQIDQQMASSGVNFRYIIANPSSYLYFTPERRVGTSTTQFAIPTGNNCLGYNTYKYGLTGLNSYMSAVGADKIRAQYKDKNVIYLLGESDTDPNDSSLDKSCEGELQGNYRLERGTIYYNYIGHLYGASIYTKHIKATVPGIAHNGNGMYNSTVARQYLFDPIQNQFPTNTPTTVSATIPPPTQIIPSYVCGGSLNSICPSPTPKPTSTAPHTTSQPLPSIPPTQPEEPSEPPLKLPTTIPNSPAPVSNGGNNNNLIIVLLNFIKLFLELLLHLNK